jgi:23S rRNA (cytidine2498-2'-O)-methyltransferase
VKQFLAWVQDPEAFGQDPAQSPLIERTMATLRQTASPPWEVLHFWVRDGLWPAGQMGRGGEADLPAGLHRFVQALHAAAVGESLIPSNTALPQNAAAGQRVLDICLVSPGQLLLGEHVVQQASQKWPGGALPLVPTNPPPISRAYYKVREAVAWAELRIRPGQHAVEIGAAPGGSCQWLLEQDLRVTGVDPADIDPIVAQHPQFTHIRRRGREVKRRDLFACDWLLSDANLPPTYILDTLEDLLGHPRVSPQGLILTLKLPDTKLLADWPQWTDRVRRWGFNCIRGRQLIYNRQEICLVATR